MVGLCPGAGAGLWPGCGSAARVTCLPVDPLKRKGMRCASSQRGLFKNTAAARQQRLSGFAEYSQATQNTSQATHQPCFFMGSALALGLGKYPVREWVGPGKNGTRCARHPATHEGPAVRSLGYRVERYKSCSKLTADRCCRRELPESSTYPQRASSTPQRSPRLRRSIWAVLGRHCGRGRCMGR